MLSFFRFLVLFSITHLESGTHLWFSFASSIWHVDFETIPFDLGERERERKVIVKDRTNKNNNNNKQELLILMVVCNC